MLSFTKRLFSPCMHDGLPSLKFSFYDKFHQGDAQDSPEDDLMVKHQDSCQHLSPSDEQELGPSETRAPTLMQIHAELSTTTDMPRLTSQVSD